MTVAIDAIRECFEGAVPATVATASPDGTPNVSYVSQVHYVDREHVALSFQFFSKTRENVLANPRATVLVIHPPTAAQYRLALRYLRTETEGALFERMKAKLAGIRPIMITGDHPLTARFIAYDLGITDNGRVKTGLMLDAMSDEELKQVVDEVSIYARVTPANKLEIVEMLQKKGHIVAMTGDGVNDSPALKRADIGVAMGITGTDVSKEASDMVLLDDNFATIVAAVEEGRVIYDNIRRFVKFSIAGNVGKVLVMLLTPLLLGAEAAVALLPLQLLWLNLLTDGLLGLGLGVEPAERNTMRRPPRDPAAGIFSEGLGGHVLWVGAIIGVVALVAGWLYHDPANPDDATWQTMIFTTLAFLQVGQALASRSSRESFFTLGLRTNLTLFGLAVLVIVLQLGVLYAPFLEQFFGIVPLAPRDLLIAAALGSLAFVAIEIEKWFLRRRS